MISDGSVVRENGRAWLVLRGGLVKELAVCEQCDALLSGEVGEGFGVGGYGVRLCGECARRRMDKDEGYYSVDACVLLVEGMMFAAARAGRAFEKEAQRNWAEFLGYTERRIK